MTDPWSAFVAAAARAEVAGYFESAPRPSGDPTGRAVWFDRADQVVTVRRATDLRTLARDGARHLRAAPSRAVLGYLGFEAVGLFEPALAGAGLTGPFPLGEFALVDRAHAARLPPRRLDRRPAPRLRLPPPRSDSLAGARYARSVRRLIADIRDGEAFQVVLAHRRRWTRPADLLRRAGDLRARERYAFFYYLQFGPRVVVGASPESVLEVDGRSAFVNPIAGTRPTGRGRAGRRPLEADAKELAEHRMLVDLARNDLGRVARPGTVRVLVSERRERFARLEHLVSHVGARLAPGVGPWEALAAAFPAGTVSGAPKIRAVELLRREERTWRGPYAGTVGLLRPRDRATWALTIRSGFAAGRDLYTAAGSGIVHRSRPAREFQETRTKLAQVEASLVGELP